MTLHGKVEPGLLKRLHAGEAADQHDVIVVLRQQTDPTPLLESSSRQVSGSSVVVKLQETARRTQARLLVSLEA